MAAEAPESLDFLTDELAALHGSDGREHGTNAFLHHGLRQVIDDQVGSVVWGRTSGRRGRVRRPEQVRSSVGPVALKIETTYVHLE